MLFSFFLFLLFGFSFHFFLLTLILKILLTYFFIRGFYEMVWNGLKSDMIFIFYFFYFWFVERKEFSTRSDVIKYVTFVLSKDIYK